MTKIELNVEALAPEDVRKEFTEANPLANMDDEQRAATLNILRGTLADLLMKIDEWVPESFYAVTGHQLDLVLSFDMEEVDKEVLRRHHAAELRMKAAKSELLKMDKEFDD